MNVLKAQKELFNALIAGQRVAKFEFDENNVFLTPDGFHGFVIPYTQIQINLEKAVTQKALDIRSIVNEENLCKLTKEMLIGERPRRYFRKLKRGDTDIFFNEKFMQCFQNPKFYCKDRYGMIVVTEDISAKRNNEIVGVILPVRVRPEDYLD